MVALHEIAKYSSNNLSVNFEYATTMYMHLSCHRPNVERLGGDDVHFTCRTKHIYLLHLNTIRDIKFDCIFKWHTFLHENVVCGEMTQIFMNNHCWYSYQASEIQSRKSVTRIEMFPKWDSYSLLLITKWAQILSVNLSVWTCWKIINWRRPFCVTPWMRLKSW